MEGDATMTKEDRRFEEILSKHLTPEELNRFDDESLKRMKKTYKSFMEIYKKNLASTNIFNSFIWHVFKSWICTPFVLLKLFSFFVLGGLLGGLSVWFFLRFVLGI